MSEPEFLWARVAQEKLVVPLLKRVLGNVEIESKDLQSPDWDYEGMDKLVRKKDGGSFIMAVRSRTWSYHTRTPRDVTLRITNRSGAATEIHKLNARYYFYGITDSDSLKTMPESFVWWVIWHIAPFRERYDGYGKPLPEFPVKTAPSSGDTFIPIPIDWLQNEGYLVALKRPNEEIVKFSPYWGLIGTPITIVRLDNFT